MSSLDIFQQTYAISSIANTLTNEKGETLAKLQQLAETQIPALLSQLGGWESVWGPVVYMDPSNTAGSPDNVWCVAHKSQVDFSNGQKEDVYVVGIAGTANFSQYDIMVEDLGVDSAVDFKDWVKKGLTTAPKATPSILVNNWFNTYISMGTALGVSILLNTPVPKGGSAAGPGTNLADFLATIPSSSKLIFTGHSLGGALSPAVALAWLTSDLKKEIPSKNVLTYPSAGTSPWNHNFVKLFESKLDVPSGSHLTGFRRWNTNVINSLDAVPMAWSTDVFSDPDQNLHKIPHLNNAKGADFWSLVAAVVVKLIPTANASGVAYRPLKASTFTGTGQPPYPTPNDPWPKDGEPFLPQWSADAGFHHMDDYQIEFGLPSFVVAKLPSASGDPENASRLAGVLSVIANASKSPEVVNEVQKKKAELERCG